MDLPCPDNETNSGYQQFIWEQFVRIQHDFEEFTKGIPSNVEDSSNPDLTNINEANPRSPEVNHHQLLNLLEDFDEFEKTMHSPPYKMNPLDAQDFNEQNNGEENQECYKVTQNRTEEEWQLVAESTGDSNKNMNITGCMSHTGTRGDSQPGSPFLTLANMTTCGDASGGSGGHEGDTGDGGVARSFMKHGDGSGGGRARAPAKTQQRRKRKCTRAYETEAVTDPRFHRQKINNIATAALRLHHVKNNTRATVARLFEQKQGDVIPTTQQTTLPHQAYDVQLQEQIQKFTK